MFLKTFINMLQKNTCISDVKNEELTEKVRSYVLTSLSLQRYEHSLRVAQTAALLSKHYGEDTGIAYIAGLSHDMCKEMDKKLLESIAIENGEMLTDTEIKKPSLLHGKVGAILLRRDFNITHPEVLEAVAHHTFGKKSMSNIAKIVCIADKIEPGRPYMSSLKMKNLLKLSLDDLLANILKEIIDVRKKKKDIIFPEALWVLENSNK